MLVSSDQTERIKKTLEAFISDAAPCLYNFDEPINVRELAAELDFLPMVFEWSGCFGIQSNGEIVVLDLS